MIGQRKRMWKSMVRIVCIVVFLLGIIFWFATFASVDELLHPTRNGAPNIFQHDTDYLSSVDEIAVAGNRLYLLYNTLNNVKVYNLDGAYLYTISFPHKEYHGISLIYASEGEMWFFAKGMDSEFYYFSDDQFVGKIEIEDANDTLKELIDEGYRTSIDEEGNTYQISMGNIEREAPNGEKQIVIHQTFLMSLFQYRFIIWGASFLAFIVLFVMGKYF